MKRTLVALVLLLSLFAAAPASAQQAALQYRSPRPNAVLVPAGTTIALRLTEPLALNGREATLFSVVGTQSGAHAGTVALADDSATLIFRPAVPFAPGERVDVSIRAGLTTRGGAVYPGANWSFDVSPRTEAVAPMDLAAALAAANADVAPSVAPAYARWEPFDDAALPEDFPVYTIETAANGTAAGYVFTDISDLFGGGFFLTILNDAGEPLFYRRMTSFAIDFKLQPNGQLSYCQDGKYWCMDNTYTVVDMWQAGNGYGWTDNHDLQIMPNGHALLMIYDPEPVDMSQIVEGGRADAIVEGLIIQEIDASKNVVFEWRSWDHIPITDSYVSLTTQRIDYIHGNAVELDDDGNLLISSRNICEITKIDRSTGDIIWRLGGKQNDFEFTNEAEPWFYFQHDVRRLDNGNVSIFDNRANVTPPQSRAVEYALDEQAMTATRVWEYYNPAGTITNFMGNAQRLPNGNTLIGWGNAGLITEVKPNGDKALEIDLAGWRMSYRSFRFQWQGYPSTKPTLFLGRGDKGLTLGMSWNGATEIASYAVYGGNQPEPTTLLTTVPKNGYETFVNFNYSDPKGLYRYYRVMPLDGEGQPTRYSADVTTFEYVILPLVSNAALP
ncbi:MAG: hypothetical protein GX557_08570 [Chloroflexi bacterium]|nr:hypothetical protein [Chloroflexota bacterium]